MHNIIYTYIQVGTHGLPYAEMLKRQEKMAYYAQVYVCIYMCVCVCVCVCIVNADINAYMHTTGENGILCAGIYVYIYVCVCVYC